MDAYLALCKRILDEGVVVENERTGVKCKTVINATLEYDVENGKFPLVTTRKSYYAAAIAELLGYLRGYSSAAQFRALGAKTWDANANANKAWLSNPNRLGHDDMGRVYGVQGRYWQSFTKDGKLKVTDQLLKVVNNLSAGCDDRGEIITFWNPGEFDQGCLRPCMHTHNFSILGGKLYLTSYQRSCDVPLGLVFNQVQVYVLLALMSRITGIPPGKAYHHIVNAHIYENQISLMEEQVAREPYASPTLIISDKIKTFDDLMDESLIVKEVFEVVGYESHPPINYPFSV